MDIQQSLDGWSWEEETIGYILSGCLRSVLVGQRTEDREMRGEVKTGEGRGGVVEIMLCHEIQILMKAVISKNMLEM